jgi:hypothetical protein
MQQRSRIERSLAGGELDDSNVADGSEAAERLSPEAAIAMESSAAAVRFKRVRAAGWRD